jgi:hypothetical protein
MNKQTATGTVEGTGAAISFNIGFIPSFVEVINIDGDAVLKWEDNMGDGKGYKILGTGLGALIASGGITRKGDAEADTIRGFTLGADTDVNVDSETLIYVAYR